MLILLGQRHRRRGHQSAGSRRGGVVADVRDLQGWTGVVARQSAESAGSASHRGADECAGPGEGEEVVGLVYILATVYERKYR